MFHHKHHIALHSYFMIGLKFFGFSSPLQAIAVYCARKWFYGRLIISCIWIFQAIMSYYGSIHLICIIYSSRVKVLQRINVDFICGIHLMKLGFWLTVKFEFLLSQFLEVSYSYYHLSYHGSKNYSIHSEDLRFWSLIGYLLTQGAKLGFWI